MRKKEKLIKFYMVFYKEDGSEVNASIDIPLTVVTEKQQALEFSVRNTCLKYSDHFINWANLKGLDINNPKVQYEYANEVRDELKYYYRQKYYLSNNDLAAILRLTQGCTPIGCSYELAEERTAYSHINDILSKLDRKLDSNE